MHIKTCKFWALASVILAPALIPATCLAFDSLSVNPLAPRMYAADALAPYKTDKPIMATDDGLDSLKELDVWSRIRNGYAIADLEDPLVAKHTTWYASRPDYIARTTARASRYLFHVVQELEKRGMPSELALLPFIESAFNPQAFSSANAAGMWQFVPGTGRDFNLKQTMFRDDRRSVIASTDAALTYLQKLYGMFGDWQLALAAYNWGEGSVLRAIKKNQSLGKPTDFESLADLMPAETRNYVPKLQAVKNIISNPAQYGISLPMIVNQPYFTTVDKTSDIDLTIAAQLAELSLDDFRALNPQFNRPVITGNDQTTQILLPKENAVKFNLNLAQWGRALSTWTTHKITSARERIETLASRFDTTPDLLRQVNNIPQKTMLKAGSTILVPKISTSLNIDITSEIADNATLLFEADRPESKHASGRSRGNKSSISGSKAHHAAPIALVQSHMARNDSAKTEKSHKRRRNQS